MATVNKALYTAKVNAAVFQSTFFTFLLYIGIYIFRKDIVDAGNRVQSISTQELLRSYDFIIIGGGSAGSVVANRLSENENWKVLLIEAGGPEPILSEIPIYMRKIQKTNIDWQFNTQPSDQFALDQGNTLYWPRGKVIGGTSVLNGMIYCRGNPKDYDLWETEFGNPGWSYKDVLPYFKKSEDMRIPGLENSPYHSTGGYLTVENFRYNSPVAQALLEGSQEIGYKLNPDINGKSQLGVTLSPATVRDGLRCSTAKGFLRPIIHRKNLDIILDALVTKIIIDEPSKCVKGVIFEKDGKRIKIRANKEVILSAGSVQTPQILMLNGIGPKKHLTSKGIKTIVDAPGVGQNLQDHVSMGGLIFLIDTPISTLPNGPAVMANLVFTFKNLFNFLIRRKGIYYDQSFAELVNFVNTKYNTDLSRPDVQIIMATTSVNNVIGLANKTNIGLTPQLYEQFYGPIVFTKAGFEMTPIVMRPKSTGHIELQDNDPHSPPLIYPNYFSKIQDLNTLVEGAKISYNISKSPALQKYKATFYNQPMPGCENYSMESDQYWACQARHYTRTIYHPCGTARMGPSNDTQAVVSSELLVHGINNLRVIDASVMPAITTGNINAPTIMIAEKASDSIKQKWTNK